MTTKEIENKLKEFENYIWSIPFEDMDNWDNEILLRGFIKSIMHRLDSSCVDSFIKDLVNDYIGSSYNIVYED